MGEDRGGASAAAATAPPLDTPLDRRDFLRLAGLAGAGLLVPAWLPGAARAAEPLETARAWRAMGTLLEVRVPDLPAAEAIEAVRWVRRRVEALEAALTLYRGESPLVAFNAARAGAWMDAPAALVEAVGDAVAAARASGGAFDPTVTPFVRALGLYEAGGDVPPPGPSGIPPPRAFADRPCWDAIEVDRGNRRLRRLDPRVELDLGGIGKGIAVDAALETLRAAGSGAALVNLGGSIGVLGAPPGAPRGWPVGIAHPRRPGAVWRTLSLSRGHLATSGDYERRVDTARGRLHHLIDPRTGEPAPGVAGVTVWAPAGIGADVQSTACFVTLARGERPAGTAWWSAIFPDADGGLLERSGGGEPGASS